MKKLCSLVLAVVFMASCAFAAGNRFTGDVWGTLSEREKVNLVSYFKAKAREEGIRIRKGAKYYSELLDDFYRKHDEWRKEDVNIALKTLIIMEYDWSQKGVDKDALAREWLGDEVFEANKARVKN